MKILNYILHLWKHIKNPYIDKLRHESHYQLEHECNIMHRILLIIGACIFSLLLLIAIIGFILLCLSSLTIFIKLISIPFIIWCISALLLLIASCCAELHIIHYTMYSHGL